MSAHTAPAIFTLAQHRLAEDVHLAEYARACVVADNDIDNADGVGDVLDTAALAVLDDAEDVVVVATRRFVEAFGDGPTPHPNVVRATPCAWAVIYPDANPFALIPWQRTAIVVPCGDVHTLRAAGDAGAVMRKLFYSYRTHTPVMLDEDAVLAWVAVTVADNPDFERGLLFEPTAPVVPVAGTDLERLFGSGAVLLPLTAEHNITR